MKTLVYATGSVAKFDTVRRILDDLPLQVVQEVVSVDEIQSSDVERIAKQKALDAFEQIQKPLFVTDTFWSIPALNGFPGAYMKEVNQWFDAQDFLNLMKDKVDRRIIARDAIVFVDGGRVELFSVELVGEIAQSASLNVENSLDSVAQFNGVYLSDYKARGEVISAERAAWDDFKVFLRGYYGL